MHTSYSALGSGHEAHASWPAETDWIVVNYVLFQFQLSYPFSGEFFSTVATHDCGTSLPVNFSSVNLQEMFRFEVFMAPVTLVQLSFEMYVVI